MKGRRLASPPPSAGGAADRQSLDAKGRLADPDRNALAVLAAGSDPGVHPQVVADHRYAGQRIGPVADQRGALDWCADLAVFDQVGLGHREHELAVRDVVLPAAKVGRVHAFLDRADDLFGLRLAGQHARVRHPGHRQAGEGLAPGVAGQRGFHQTRVERILHVAAQNAVFDQHGARGGVALVVDRERACRFTSAMSTAWRAYSCSRSSLKKARSSRPPPPEKPCSRRPACSAITVSDTRTRGRTSEAISPSLRATRITSYSEASVAITWRTRGSRARAIRSSRSSSCTWAAAPSAATGSSVPYSGRCERGASCGATRIRPAEPLRAIDRTVCAACSSASSEMSSEYEKAVLSSTTARTPTPWSMPKEPDFTIPSSREYDSLRVYWKYRSA